MSKGKITILAVGAIKLLRWRSDNNVSRREFAKLISPDPKNPMTQHAIGKYERGESRPSLDVIERIKSATDGYILADDWIGI